MLQIQLLSAFGLYLCAYTCKIGTLEIFGTQYSYFYAFYYSKIAPIYGAYRKRCKDSTVLHKSQYSAGQNPEWSTALRPGDKDVVLSRCNRREHKATGDTRGYERK